MNNQITAKEIEFAVARWFGTRVNLIVPNVSWGLEVHECDLMVLSKSGYATEVEIKVSKGDLVRDAGKSHRHESDRIKYLYFAMPSSLCRYVEHIPARAGILAINKNHHVHEIARPRANENAVKFDEGMQFALARLGALRIWDLKDQIHDLKQQVKKLQSRVVLALAAEAEVKSS